MSENLSRRMFVAATAGTIACGAVASAMAEEPAAAEAPVDYASQVTQTLEADVVVMGSGVSGIAAGVAAAQEGLKTIIIEASAIRGAVIRSTEGIAAVDSPIQREQGIEISIPEVIKVENEACRYCLDGRFWKEQLERSGDNIQWLIDNGVQFTGVVDEYRGMGAFPVFHWFPGDHEAQTYYGDPMEAEFKSHEGCELLLSTRGRALKMEDGRVAGIYATTSDGGVLEINAPAVILAGGGYGGSLEEVAKRFWRMPVGRYSCDGALTNVGDGINMVIAAGGVDDSAHNSFNGLVMGDTPNRAFGLYAVDPKTMWVNQDGERIVDESACKGLPSLPAMNLLFQHNEIYSIFDAAMMGDALEDAKVEAVDSPTGVFYADSIDDLAAQINIDAEALAASIANYNALIEAGVDTDFGKDLTGLAPITEPPFFAFRQILSAHGTVGGIVVDLKYEVIRPDGSPIPGLYAVGMESNMNYRKFAYSFAISGGAMGQAVDSGR